MKKYLFAVLHMVGITRFAAWWNRQRVVILCYHGVTSRADRSPDDPLGLHTRANRFEAQLDYLQRHHCAISLDQYLTARSAGRALPRHSVILTFDDGYRNFLTMAAPRLLARSLPASVFLVTDKIRSDNGSAAISAWTTSDDKNYLSWREVRELQESGIEFGSHTCSHSKLSELSWEEAARELSESQAVIIKQLEKGALPFAYPYGAYTPEIVERTRSLGYSCALTTDAGVNDIETDLFTLRRMLIGDDDDVPAFAARVSGLTGWLAKVRPGSLNSAFA
jgi:peptidoglycan/xylan/chitin deacetylase (PgdA/CDA1 family)